MDVRLTTDPSDVLRYAGDFLASRPVEHNLVSTLLQQRVASTELGRYAWVQDGSSVVGTAFQSPLDFFATTTPMPRPAVEALVNAFADVAPDLSGVNAEAATSAAFAGAWATRLATPAEPIEAHRIYRCDRLRQPASLPPGAARLATSGDFETVATWNKGFHDETAALPAVTDAVAAAHRLLATRRVWLWDAGEPGPVSMVGAVRPAHGVSRIGPVYTPPDRRRRGFGAALTAAGTQAVLDEGAVAALFTELVNPVSNALYQRLGYEPVSELVRYRFGVA